MAATDPWEAIRSFLEPKPPQYNDQIPTDKQKVFLRSEQLEVLYGGKAGGGKSSGLLMAASQWVDTPGYAAVIFRNTYSDLALPGALMDRSHDWWDDIKEVRWHQKGHTWEFPSGATITFGYLEKPNDHLRYKGAEFQFIGFDEVTEIREKHYRYLFSRLRKPSGKGGLALARVPLRMRCTSNPAPNWVRRRFIEEGPKKGRLYIPAGLDDNPYVDRESYMRALAELDDVERARLEAGDWYAEETGAKFSRDYFPIIGREDVPTEAWLSAVRYWDTASTLPSEQNPDPDWTAGAKVGLADGRIYILDMRHDRQDPGGVENLIRQTAAEDGVSVKIRMEATSGHGKQVVDHYSRHVLLGYDFDGWPAVRDKVSRANTWAGKAKRREVILVRGDWITDFLDEAVAFGGTTQGHDDQVDAVSGAWEVLAGLGQKQKRGVEIIV